MSQAPGGARGGARERLRPPPQEPAALHRADGGLCPAVRGLRHRRLRPSGLYRLDPAGDLLALNKEPKTVTITISSDDSFSDVTDRLKEEGLIEYKFLFKLFAAVTGGDDDVTMGTYTLNTDMDYRALLNGMSANSSTKATVSVTITRA